MGRVFSRLVATRERHKATPPVSANVRIVLADTGDPVLPMIPILRPGTMTERPVGPPVPSVGNAYYRRVA